MEKLRKLIEIKYYTGNKEGLTTITNCLYAYSEDEIKHAKEIHELAKKYVHQSVMKRIFEEA